MFGSSCQRLARNRLQQPRAVRSSKVPFSQPQFSHCLEKIGISSYCLFSFFFIKAKTVVTDFDTSVKVALNSTSMRRLLFSELFLYLGFRIIYPLIRPVSRF